MTSNLKLSELKLSKLKLSERLALEKAAKPQTVISVKPRNPNFIQDKYKKDANENTQSKSSSNSNSSWARSDKQLSKQDDSKKDAPKSNLAKRSDPYSRNYAKSNAVNAANVGKSKSPFKSQTQFEKYAHQPRFIAAEILDAIEHGRSLSECFEPLSAKLNDADKRFTQFLLYGALREYEALNDRLNQMMHKPIKASESIVLATLILAIFEATSMRTQDHACVNLWVETIKQRQKTWAIGLCNGILRNILRDGLPSVNTHLGRVNLPNWLWAKFSQDFPKHAQQMSVYYQTHPVMSLRVNLSQTTREAYLQILKEHNIDAYPHQFVKSAIVLKEPMGVNSLPFFKTGMISVQDASAQFATLLLNPCDNENILDACAAPGGKTGHILEIAKPRKMIALDVSAKRLTQVQDNLNRIFGLDGNNDKNNDNNNHTDDFISNEINKNLNIKLVSEDILNYAPKNDLFDAILLDAPCSGTGILHRHPDIKRLRQAADIVPLVQLQARILRHCWNLLKPGGRLLYATCSSLKAENEAQMQDFFADVTDAQEIPIKTDFGIAQLHGLQILPIAIDEPSADYLNYPQKMDGFYYCLILKSLD
ncbi:16S rRNA m(5)C967 methyltransferase [Gammaproteobacteria bacterium]|nr:16S rRNA m(5)C967 methyltransferase [Gammaproteobacteria bacterium]